MKKKIITLLLLCCMLTGCEEYDETNITPSLSSVNMEYSTFHLIQDEKTNIVYIDNVIKTESEFGWNYNHIYTPYYSKNGKLCRFVDGRVVEIDE